MQHKKYIFEDLKKAEKTLTEKSLWITVQFSKE